MPRKIAVLNQKGGVGKTTTVANIASALSRLGQRVLVIDMDPQAHLTIHFGLNGEQTPSGIYSVLTGEQTAEEAITGIRPNLWILAAGIDLVGAEAELINEVGREIILRNQLEAVQDRFDVILIDCPPSLGILTLNALSSMNEVLIPVQPHFLALQGFGRLLQTVLLVQQRIHPALRVSAILMCMFDSRTSLSAEVRDDIERFLAAARESRTPWSNAQIIPVYIRRNIKLAEAPSHGQSIFEYEPSCHGAEDYLAVTQMLFPQSAPPPDADPQPQETETPESTQPTINHTAQTDTEDQSDSETFGQD